MIVARKKFTFNGRQYLPGDTVKKGTLDKYQEETFLRTSLVVEQPDPPKRTRKAAVVELEDAGV